MSGGLDAGGDADEGYASSPPLLRSAPRATLGPTRSPGTTCRSGSASWLGCLTRKQDWHTNSPGRLRGAPCRPLVAPVVGVGFLLPHRRPRRRRRRAAPSRSRRGSPRSRRALRPRRRPPRPRPRPTDGGDGHLDDVGLVDLVDQGVVHEGVVVEGVVVERVLIEEVLVPPDPRGRGSLEILGRVELIVQVVGFEVVFCRTRSRPGKKGKSRGNGGEDHTPRSPPDVGRHRPA